MRLERLWQCASGIAATVLLCACGGGSGTIPARQGARAIQTVQFTMHWPSRAGLASMRRPMYVSPSTLSLAIEVNNDPALTVIANNPSTTGGSATTTVAVSAPAGADTFYFSLWDATNGKGNELGQTQVNQTIVAGRLNSIGATIDGVLAKIGVTADPNQPFLQSGTGSFTLVGDVSANVAITPLDADGNVIVAPGIVPAISLGSSDGSLAVTQSSSNPSRYSVQVVRAPGVGIHPSLVASGTDANAFAATTHYPVTVSPAFFVGFSNGTAGSIQVLDASGNTVRTSGGFPGLQHPTGIAYDPDDRIVFVADPTAGGGTVFAFTENGAAAGTPIAFAGATGVAYDAQDRQIYVTSSPANAVGAFTPQGASVPFSVRGLSAPAAIAIAGSAICVTSANAGTNPSCFSTQGAAAAPAISQDPSAAANGIAYDSEQNALWIAATSSGSANLTEYDATGGYVRQSYTAGLTAPQGVAVNPVLHEIAVIDSASGTIVHFTNAPPYVQDVPATIPLSTAVGTPTAFALAY